METIIAYRKLYFKKSTCPKKCRFVVAGATRHVLALNYSFEGNDTLKIILEICRNTFLFLVAINLIYFHFYYYFGNDFIEYEFN